MKKALFLVLVLASVGNADTYKTVYNPWTMKLDFINGNMSSLNMYDSSLCLWNAVVNTSGAWVLSLVSCPPVVVVRPCTTGIPLGILLSITCP